MLRSCLFHDDKCQGCIEQHHVIPRSQGGHNKGTMSVCSYHHLLITTHRINNYDIIQKANSFYGFTKYYQPYKDSKRILLKELS